MSVRKSLAELAAELEDPAPKDVDPEAFGHAVHNSDSEDEIDDNAGREHYENVGASKLRKPAQPILGAQYSGSKVSRKDLADVEDLEDDPFARRDQDESSENDEGSSEQFDDPDEVDLDIQDEDDEEIDSDDAFEDGEEESFRKKGFTFKDSGRSASELRKVMADAKDGDDRIDGDEQDSQGDSETSSLDAGFDDLQVNENSDSMDDSQSDDDSEDSINNDSDSEEGPDDAILRAMASTEHRNLVSSLSGQTKSEVSKGTAVKKQYTIFDTLVGTRVHLQKCLIAANTLTAAQNTDTDSKSLAEAAEGAETAAIGILNSLTSLLHSMQSASLSSSEPNQVLGKRPFSATVSMPSSDIYQGISSTHKVIKAHRRSVLTKWANKTQATTLSTRNRLVQKPSEDGLLSALDGQLIGSNQERLIQKTRLARSCAPIQQALESSTVKTSTQEDDQEDVSQESVHSIPVYDDADFYAQLLRELIDHKKSYTNATVNGLSNSLLASATTPANLLRGNKSKRANVDTKASKGRKMKYTVHEKLQNFMAPVDLGVWERRQAEELFAGLLGKKIAKLDEQEDAMDVVDIVDEDMEAQGLRLFGGN